MCGKQIKSFIKHSLFINFLIQLVFLQAADNNGMKFEKTFIDEQNQPAAMQAQTSLDNQALPDDVFQPSLIGQNQATQKLLKHDLTNSENTSLSDSTLKTGPLDNSVKSQAENQIALQTSLNLTDESAGTDLQDPPILGIDTVSLEEPQGNWLFKRIWWERAQETYEKVRILVAQIMDYRMEFFMHRSEINRVVLDPFYSQVGFAQGQIKEVIERVLQALQTEKNSTMLLDGSERGLNNDVETTKDVLERFKLDIEMVYKLDASIDKSLEQLVAECNKVRTYEQEAWQNYKQIGQELSDSKARELFYYLDVHMRQIKDIQRYLQQDFARYFQDLIRQISSETERLLGVVNKLKEQGIDFKKQISKLPEEHSSQTSDQVAPVLDTQDEEVTFEKRSFFSELKFKVAAFFGAIKEFFVSSFNAALGFLGNKKIK